MGIPAGTILNLYDELYNYQDKIHHILTAHEQGASHAADGYARSTGKVGVCFATSGPGATNLTTGIATAYMDSSPVVFITCNVTEETLGKDALPGGGHHRHRHAHHQGHLSGPGPQDHPRRDAPGLRRGGPPAGPARCSSTF